MRILIVEDEPTVAEAISSGLKAEGFDTVVAASGEEGFFQASTESFEIIVLDLMLPGRDGLEILNALRGRGVHTPVIVLTARDGVDDRVRGLDQGADDYLAKPFAFPELLARIRALLRRGRPEDVLKLRVADLEMDLVSRAVSRGGREIALTAKEYDLLEYLMRHAGQIVTRAMLSTDVWKASRRATPLDNVIDVHITRLRKKVDHGRGKRLIHTVRGLGFVLREEAGGGS
ncbi:two component transcriptional regulator, winged helix family [Alkalidesulfovibrio alkalitolerans DSM 16529]|uniref:Two component transcriptional regulator, winged helix family n=1 Tax=Alkalidesulfovibrio alkalitolerans DSM 16529 TaxID=1121439 RepID=S7UGY3_9BACT|nr:response regulator [Alkalidesulfovibrio alkalitolerans]EPR33094.1 two component transcriptional regulator, winged helix family [Alkalidesulfovibrio alkalitolerans DSM 16529]